MKTKTKILCVLLCFSGSMLMAQNTSLRSGIASSLQDALKEKHNQSTKLEIKKVEKKVKKGQVVKADTAYYRDVVRHYGWMDGLGEAISLQTAKHLPYYYRMSMKNASGRWQHVEAMHNGKPTTAHPISTYIIDKDQADDAMANQEWITLLKSVTQWVFTSNYEGDEVVEERAYDADNNMVYSYSAIQNSDGRMTGSYNDAWGFPADMREDPTCTYGSVVCITYDRNGCDSIIDYLDGQGMRKHNNNGVDQDRYAYDDQGYIVLHKSCNCVGDPIIDNWGNCGYTISYDHKNGRKTIIYRDKEWNPMRMPSNRAADEETFIRCDYQLDQWGRVETMTILTADGKPDITTNGIHQIRYTFYDDGAIRTKRIFDIGLNELEEIIYLEH